MGKFSMVRPFAIVIAAATMPLTVASCVQTTVGKSPDPSERVVGGGGVTGSFTANPHNPNIHLTNCAPQVTTVRAEAPGRARAEADAIRIWSEQTRQHGYEYSDWANARNKSLTCGQGNTGPGSVLCTATGTGCTL